MLRAMILGKSQDNALVTRAYHQLNKSNLPVFGLRDRANGKIIMVVQNKAIAFVVRAELFHRYHASTVSAFLFISPITGLCLSNWLLDDPLTWTVGLGGGMVALGVFLVYHFT